MATRAYPLNLIKVWNGSVNWSTATIKVLPLNASGTYNAAHEFVSSVVANEITHGARPIVAGSVTDDSGNTRIKVTVANTQITSVDAAQTLNAVVVYVEVTNDADSLPMFFVDGVDIVTDGNNVTITFDAAGIYTFTY